MAAFYKRCWSVVKDDIMAAVNYFYQTGKFEKSFNAFFIALVPKKAGAMDMKVLRPISLVGNFYKIISKTLAKKIKEGDELTSCGLTVGIHLREVNH